MSFIIFNETMFFFQLKVPCRDEHGIHSIPKYGEKWYRYRIYRFSTGTRYQMLIPGPCQR
ncbi:hypothetical protein HanIR_Chr11g0503261 [Helianthus annuus]|nr:hypothetical protein HanIR_Chr11g0503261 [Helianthus annuus]